jgi:hypothetical protein
MEGSETCPRSGSSIAADALWCERRTCPQTAARLSGLMHRTTGGAQRMCTDRVLHCIYSLGTLRFGHRPAAMRTMASHEEPWPGKAGVYEDRSLR